MEQEAEESKTQMKLFVFVSHQAKHSRSTKLKFLLMFFI